MENLEVMANSKTSENPHQRKKFLVDHGCSRVRDAEGSHSMWKDATGQKITLCESPASGTWKKIKKQARDADNLRKKQEQSKMIALKAEQAAKKDKERRRTHDRRKKARRREIKRLYEAFKFSAEKFDNTEVEQAVIKRGLDRRTYMRRGMDGTA